MVVVGCAFAAWICHIFPFCCCTFFAPEGRGRQCGAPSSGSDLRIVGPGIDVDVGRRGAPDALEVGVDDLTPFRGGEAVPVVNRASGGDGYPHVATRRLADERPALKLAVNEVPHALRNHRERIEVRDGRACCRDRRYRAGRRSGRLAVALEVSGLRRGIPGEERIDILVREITARAAQVREGLSRQREERRSVY